MEHHPTVTIGRIGHRELLRRAGLMLGAVGLLAACGQQPATPAKPAAPAADAVVG